MQGIQSVFNEVDNDVQDIVKKEFIFTYVSEVPHVDDEGITYESGKDKKGVEITTCVLFVDIRNSVSLMEDTQSKTMGRIYTAFTKSGYRI
mgnify:CR=1 FL=1